MRTTATILTVLAILAAIAVAQEPEKTAPEISDQRLRELAGQLASDDPAVRERAFEEFRRLATLRVEFKPSGPARAVLENELVFRVDDSPLGKEKIQGSWSENGTKGNYTLESLGKGHYKLTAESIDGEGTQARFSDDGQMAELRKKYPFLKNFGGVLFIAPGRTAAGFTNAILKPLTIHQAASETKRIEKLGISVRRPSQELEFHLKLPTETTWIIETVTSGSKGEQLGLKRYDLITGADGADLTEIAPLENAETSLEVVRRSKPMRIALEPAPDHKDK